MDIAFIRHDTTTYWARGIQSATRAPMTPVTQLIQGIYSLAANEKQTLDDVRGILRKRIAVNYEPTPLCRAMVRVAAKRISSPEEFSLRDLEDAARCAGTRLLEVAPEVGASRENHFDLASERDLAPFRDDAEAMRAALKIAANVSINEKKYLSPRPIAAILTDVNGVPLGAAVNSNGFDKTAHAEVNLIQDFFRRTGRGLPEGAKIFATLKPCRMCSAMILHASEDPTAEKPARVSVFFAEEDPGRFARHTSIEGVRLTV